VVNQDNIPVLKRAMSGLENDEQGIVIADLRMRINEDAVNEVEEAVKNHAEK
jgi:hypothetical protein